MRHTGVVITTRMLPMSALLLLAAFACPASSLECRVVEDIGRRPVVGARAVLSSDRLDLPLVRSTNNDGIIVFDNLPSGEYELSIEKAGFVPYATGALGAPGKISVGNGVPQIAAVLTRFREISGRVFTPDGASAEGVAVYPYLIRPGEPAPLLNETLLARADRDGAFHIGHLSPGRYAVCAFPISPIPGPHASLPACYAASHSIRTASLVDLRRTIDAKGIDVRMDIIAGVTIEGVILPSPEVPAGAEAFVQLVVPGVAPLPAGGGPAHIGEPFQISGVAPGAYALIATPTGRNTGMLAAIARIDVRAEKIADLRLTLAPASALTGRAEFAQSGSGGATRPVAGVTVRLASDVLPPQINHLKTTGSSGEFRLDALSADQPYSLYVTPPAGTYVAAVMQGKKLLVGPPFPVVGGSSDVAILVSDDVAQVVGKVSKPSAGALVVLTGGKEQRTIFTTSEGTFAFHDLPPGNYALLALHEPAPDRIEEPGYLTRWSDRATKLTLSPGKTEVTVDVVDVAASERR